jgi:hypothetical protein
VGALLETVKAEHNILVSFDQKALGAVMPAQGRII